MLMKLIKLDMQFQNSVKKKQNRKSSTCNQNIFIIYNIHASLLNTHDFKFDQEEYINWKMYGMNIVKYTQL